MEDTYEAVRRLVFATNKIDGAYYFFSKKLGINENTLALLYALDDGKPHSQKQIGREWLIPKTTISTIVKELESAGYLTLSGKKEKIICLTESGQKYVCHILQAVYEVEQEAMERSLYKFSPEFVKAIEYFSDCLWEGFQKRMQGGEKNENTVV